MSKLELTNTLNKHIEPKLVTELIKEYEKGKTAYWLDDELKTLIHSARFSELSIKALEFIAGVLKSVVEEGSYPGSLRVCNHKEEGE